MKKVLQSYKVADVIVKKEKSDIYQIEDSKSVMECLRKLGKYKILSMPVLNEEAKVIGLIDVMDCVKPLIEIDMDLDGSQFEEMVMKFSLEALPIKDLLEKAKYQPVTEDMTVFDLLKNLQAGNVRRCVVLDGNGDVVDVLSQSRICNFLLNPKTGVLRDVDQEGWDKKTVKELKIGAQRNQKHKLLSIGEDDEVMKAFQIINEYKINALAVLNKGGQVISNISAYDLIEVLESSDFNIFRQTVAKLLQSQRKKDFSRPSVVFCKEETELNEVIKRVMNGKVHRIYILTDDVEFQGVISLGDILSSLLDAI